MNARERFVFAAILIGLGAGWGLTQPLAKVAVSAGYQHFGLIFWQFAIGTVVMTLLAAVLGLTLPRGMAQWRTCALIALIGTLVPNSASYQAYVHLPVGVMAIILSLVPILAFPMALGLGLDRFEWRRAAGILLGLGAVLMLILPGAELGLDLPVLWILVALVPSACYAFEGNFVARWGLAGLTAPQVLWGASIAGAVFSLPVAMLSGHWISPFPPYGLPDLAHVLSSVVHVFVYMGYVWLVSRAGPVFAVQISYVVTLAAFFWAWILLGDTYPALVWVSLALMLGGMALVQPRKRLKPVAQ